MVREQLFILSTTALFFSLAAITRAIGLYQWTFLQILGFEVLWILALAVTVRCFAINTREAFLRPSTKALLVPLLIFAIWLTLRGGVEGYTPNVARRICPWLIAPIAFLLFRTYPRQVLSTAATFAMLLYGSTHLGRENVQLFVIQLSALGFLALTSYWLRRALIGTTLFLASMFAHSLGALLSISVGGFHLLVRSPRLIAISLAGVGVVGFLGRSYLSTNSIRYRIQFWEQAFHAFLESPLFGLEVGQLYIIDTGQKIPTAHNLFFSLLAESGLIGLACFCFIIWSIALHWRGFPRHVQASFLCLLIWNQLDEPLYWLSPVVLFAALIASHQEEPLNEENVSLCSNLDLPAPNG